MYRESLTISSMHMLSWDVLSIWVDSQQLCKGNPSMWKLVWGKHLIGSKFGQSIGSKMASLFVSSMHVFGVPFFLLPCNPSQWNTDKLLTHKVLKLDVKSQKSDPRSDPTVSRTPEKKPWVSKNALCRNWTGSVGIRSLPHFFWWIKYDEMINSGSPRYLRNKNHDLTMRSSRLN